MENNIIVLTDRQKENLNQIANTLRGEADYIDKCIHRGEISSELNNLYIKIYKTINE